MGKVLGLGNALVDIMTQLEDDNLLQQFNLPKGSMTLVDADYASNISQSTNTLNKALVSGGSAANTISGLANLGVQTGFLGKVGDDELGKFYAQDMIKNKINPQLYIGQQATGHATALVSKDSERTFATFLGAAIEMTPDDLKAEDFDGYKYFHIEGYLVQNQPLVSTAMKMAKEKGLIVSLDLAAFNVVESNRDFLHDVVEKYVDIVFANEEEAKAFTGQEPEEALHTIAAKCEIAVVKVGSKGSYIKTENKEFTISPIVVNSIDTTGAGDLYASGFLYGLTKNLDMQKCGNIGSLLAGNVIEVMGPKMDEEKWIRLRDVVREIELS